MLFLIPFSRAFAYIHCCLRCCKVCGEAGAKWQEKVLQLYQITQLHHGLMMVGPSGSGKTAAWTVLLQALQRLEGVEGVAHVIGTIPFLNSSRTVPKCLLNCF